MDTAQQVRDLADVIRTGAYKALWRTRWADLRGSIPDSPRKTLVDMRLLDGEPKHIPRTLSVEALVHLSIWLEGYKAGTGSIPCFVSYLHDSILWDIRAEPEMLDSGSLGSMGRAGRQRLTPFDMVAALRRTWV